MLLSVSHFRGEREKKLFAGRKSFCGASRIAGFGEGTPQQVSREGQNRRIADFGTVVETCSKTAADFPCPGFSVHRANGAGLSARCARPFFLSPKIHLKGRQLPAVRGFFQISFRFCNTGKGILATAGAGKFPLSFTTTPGKGLNGREVKRATKKAANLFQTYCFHWPPVAADIQF